MTREYFRREILAIANRHGVRAGEWRKMGDRFCILFLVLSIFDSFLGSITLVDYPINGFAIFIMAIYFLWNALNCRKIGILEEQESLRYRQEALDGMWEELRR